MKRNIGRRKFIQGVTVTTVTGALAGCSSSSDGSSGGGGDGTEGGGDGSSDGGSNSGGSGSVPSEVSSYLSDVGNFDGSLADKTGQSEVTIEVGAQGNGGGFAFAPPAVKVSSGTTVIWEWTGDGGQHNVVAESGGDFESELVQEQGHTFEQTFSSSGTVTYYCQPHKAMGMKGAIVIE